MFTFRFKTIATFLISFFTVITVGSCKKEEEKSCNCPQAIETAGKSAPLFKYSITSNDIDFIIAEDPDVFKSLSFIEQTQKEMPDKRSNNLFDENAFVFKAKFEDDKEIEIWCHSSFESEAKAKEYADKICPRLGKLPSIQRDMLDHVVIHKGDETAFADNAFFVLYSDNIDKRITTNDLEETVFHESVHASLQTIHEKTPNWKLVQVADENYITEYAEDEPNLEDMPETALFAYTMLMHPGRLPADIENWIENYIPNRLAFFTKIYEQK